MDSAAISSGIGTGEAQVFKPVEDYLGEAVKLAAEKKKESAANKAKAMDLMAKLGEKHIWTQRDGAAFAKKQSDLWNQLKGKDLNDPETMMWLAQQQQELTYLADKSNTDKEQFIKASNLYQASPNKYFNDVPNKLIDYADSKNAFGDWNPGWMVEKPDVDLIIKNAQATGRETALRNAQKTVEEVGPGGIKGGTRRYLKSQDIEQYTPEEARRDFATNTADPLVHRALTEKMQFEDPTGKLYNNDVNQYVEKNIIPRITYKKDFTGATPLAGQGGGRGAGGTSPYGTMSIDKLDSTLDQVAVDTNPDFAIELINRNPRWKAAFEASKDSPLYKKSVTDEATGQETVEDMTPEERAAAWIKANIPETEAKIIPVSRTDATANKEFIWKGNKGENIKGSFSDFLDIYGKLYVQIDQNTYDEKGKIIGTEKKIIPFNAENVSKVNQEYSDKKSGHNVYDALIDFGYGDKLKPFNITTSTRSTAPSGGAKTTPAQTQPAAKPAAQPAAKPAAGPKKGDRMQTQQGLAEFNGTKWVLVK